MSLDAILLEVLPKDKGYESLYFQTNPAYVKSPIHIPRSISKPETVKIRHFYSLLHENAIILGLEVFVYLQFFENYTDKYVYVSKCDTTGLEKLTFKINEIVEPVLKFMMEYDNYKIKSKKEQSLVPPSDPSVYFRLKKLSSQLPDIYPSLKYYNNILPQEQTTNFRHVPPLKTIKLYVFTRPAKEYLFPNSSSNPHKHVISGATLLHWWMNIIDKLTVGWERKLLVPGLDSRAFLKRHSNWEEGHVFEEVEGSAVNSIPIFPDDPKGRFLEQLVVENRISKMLISRFMMELSYRQEFLGDTVGIIGCVCTGASVEHNANQPIKLISIREYKDFINHIKQIDFTNVEEVASFVSQYKS